MQCFYIKAIFQLLCIQVTLASRQNLNSEGYSGNVQYLLSFLQRELNWELGKQRSPQTYSTSWHILKKVFDILTRSTIFSFFKFLSTSWVKQLDPLKIFLTWLRNSIVSSRRLIRYFSMTRNIQTLPISMSSRMNCRAQTFPSGLACSRKMQTSLAGFYNAAADFSEFISLMRSLPWSIFLNYCTVTKCRRYYVISQSLSACMGAFELVSGDCIQLTVLLRYF